MDGGSIAGRGRGKEIETVSFHGPSFTRMLRVDDVRVGPLSAVAGLLAVPARWELAGTMPHVFSHMPFNAPRASKRYCTYRLDIAVPVTLFGIVNSPIL